MTYPALPGPLGALLGGLTLPTIRCALCAAAHIDPLDDEPPAVTIIAGTLTCAHHAADLIGDERVRTARLGQLVDELCRIVGELDDLRRATTSVAP